MKLCGDTIFCLSQYEKNHENNYTFFRSNCSMSVNYSDVRGCFQGTSTKYTNDGGVLKAGTELRIFAFWQIKYFLPKAHEITFKTVHLATFTTLREREVTRTRNETYRRAKRCTRKPSFRNAWF